MLQRVFRYGIALLLGACQLQSPTAGSDRIGPAGGQVRIPLAEGELFVLVPPGALDREVVVTGARRSEAPAGAASVTVDLGPEGTVFNQPVKLSFRPRPGDLFSAVGQSRLRVATLSPRGWEFLPTRFPAADAIEGETTHFSPFALVAQCAGSGSGVDFQLTGCPVFDPRVVTGAPVTLDITAATSSVRIFVQPTSGGGDVSFAVSGLPPNTSHYLHRDGDVRADTFTSDASGALSFLVDTSVHRLLVLATRPGSVALSSTTCVPPLGIFDAATSTCALTADVPDGDVSLADGVSLDCLDPTSRLRHSIGSDLDHRAVGVVASGGALLRRVRNCEIRNVDFGLIADHASNLAVESTHFSGGSTQGASTGGIAIDSEESTRLHVSSVTIVDFLLGLGSADSDELEVSEVDVLPGYVPPPITHVQPALVGVGALIRRGAHVTLDRIAVHDAALGTTPGAAIELQAVDYITLTNSLVERAPAFGSGLWLYKPGPASVVKNVVRDAQVGLRIDGTGAVVTGNTFTGNGTGVSLAGACAVFKNNIFGNTGSQLTSSVDLELSSAAHEGNYWGRSCPQLFVAGVDTSSATVVDSFPYDAVDSWAMTGLPGCPTLAKPIITSPRNGQLIARVRPDFLGLAPAGSALELLEGAALRGTAVTTPIGAFLIVPATDFAAGAHVVRVRARLNGAHSAFSDPVGFGIESGAPATPAITVPAGGVTVNGPEVVLAGTAEPWAAVFISEGMAEVAAAVAEADGRFQTTARFSDGAHTISAVARNAAFNASVPSPAVTFTVTSAAARAPLFGVAGRLKVTSLTTSRVAFVPSAGEVSTVRVRGTVLLTGVGKLPESNGVGHGPPAYRLHLQRELADATTGRTVAAFESAMDLPNPPGGGHAGPLDVSTRWDGTTTGGALAPPGVYLGNIRVWVERDPLGPLPPPGPSPMGPLPPDCDPGRQPPGCMFDVLHALDPVALFGRPLPDLLPGGEPSADPTPCTNRTYPDGGPEFVIGERIVVSPAVTFGPFQVDSAQFAPEGVVRTNSNNTTHPTGLEATTTTSNRYSVISASSLVEVRLTLDCPQHAQSQPHLMTPCWKGRFLLPDPGIAGIKTGGSGITSPALALRTMLTTPAAQAGPLVRVTGAQITSVRGTFDRSGLRFFTQVPAIYHTIGLTTEAWDYRPLPQESVYLDWEHDATVPKPSANPDIRHPRADQEAWLGSRTLHEFEYFADWATDTIRTDWVGQEPFTNCPAVSQLFASPALFSIRGAGLGNMEQLVPATGVITTGRFAEADGGTSIRITRAVTGIGSFSAYAP